MLAPFRCTTTLITASWHTICFNVFASCISSHLTAAYRNFAQTRTGSVRCTAATMAGAAQVAGKTLMHELHIARRWHWLLAHSLLLSQVVGIICHLDHEGEQVTCAENQHRQGRSLQGENADQKLVGWSSQTTRVTLHGKAMHTQRTGELGRLAEEVRSVSVGAQGFASEPSPNPKT